MSGVFVRKNRPTSSSVPPTRHTISYPTGAWRIPTASLTTSTARVGTEVPATAQSPRMPYPGGARGRQKLRLPPLGAALDPEDHTQSNTWQSAVSGASRGERTSSATPAMMRDRISADRTLKRVSSG